MKQFFTLMALAGSLTSCVMYQPRVVDWNDPFTGVHTRTMAVGESDQSIIMASIANMNRPYYAPAVRPLAINTLVGMALSESDTLLSFTQISPERQFDVPTEGTIAVKFLGSRRGGGGKIIYLPVVRKYHTSGGSLRVIARCNATAIRELQQGVIEIMRVDPVIVNESDPGPVDWVPGPDYAKAFQQGVPMLLGRKAASTEPQERPRDDRGLLRRIGKQKPVKN